MWRRSQDWSCVELRALAVKALFFRWIASCGKELFLEDELLTNAVPGLWQVRQLAAAPLISRDMLPGCHYKTNFSFLHCAGTSLREGKLNSKSDSQVSLPCQQTPIWINFWRFPHQHAKSDTPVSLSWGWGLIALSGSCTVLDRYSALCMALPINVSSSPLPRISCMDQMKVAHLSH